MRLQARTLGLLLLLLAPCASAVAETPGLFEDRRIADSSGARYIVVQRITEDTFESRKSGPFRITLASRKDGSAPATSLIAATAADTVMIGVLTLAEYQVEAAAQGVRLGEGDIVLGAAEVPYVPRDLLVFEGIPGFAAIGRRIPGGSETIEIFDGRSAKLHSVDMKEIEKAVGPRFRADNLWRSYTWCDEHERELVLVGQRGIACVGVETGKIRIGDTEVLRRAIKSRSATGLESAIEVATAMEMRDLVSDFQTIVRDATERPSARVEAALALGQLGEPVSESTILDLSHAALHSTYCDNSLRETGGRAYGAIIVAIPMLLGAEGLKTVPAIVRRDRVSGWAEQACYEYGAKAVPMLMDCLSSENPDTLLFATRALLNMRVMTKGVVTRLVPLLQNRGVSRGGYSVRTMAAFTLGYMKAFGLPALKDLEACLPEGEEVGTDEDDPAGVFTYQGPLYGDQAFVYQVRKAIRTIRAGTTKAQ
jgi:hypothetical protein